VIRHIVILNFKKNDRLDYLTLLESTRPVVAQIQGIVKYNIYRNESQYTPPHIESLGVEIIFENHHALETFMTHPKHHEARACPVFR